MDSEATVQTLLATLTSSLNSAITSIPGSKAITAPENGISLLDTKNELLLSYLQNLVFLIIIKLRSRATNESPQTLTTTNNFNGSSAQQQQQQTATTTSDISALVVKKLVELRVYLEKGVRPLESRLKYQIDKVLNAAAEENAAARLSSHPPPPSSSTRKNPQQDDESSSSSCSADEEAPTQSNRAKEISDLSYRPNPHALLRPTQPNNPSELPPSSSTTASAVYRPPRITPTSLPTTTRTTSRASSKPLKSATLDEFVSTELSSAPVAEPSIGSTLTSLGRRSKTSKEVAADADRRAYEEANFVRLPKESKKERARLGNNNKGRQGGGYGGEEWRGLGEGVERIERLTRRKEGGGILRRKRGRGEEDGGRGGGERIGERFEKRRRMMMMMGGRKAKK